MKCVMIVGHIATKASKNNSNGQRRDPAKMEQNDNANVKYCDTRIFECIFNYLQFNPSLFLYVPVV